jgi:hypothetical protein
MRTKEIAQIGSVCCLISFSQKALDNCFDAPLERESMHCCGGGNSSPSFEAVGAFRSLEAL